MWISFTPGLVLALAAAVVAYRLRALSASGVIAAAMVGAIVFAAGLGWAILLLLFFVSSTVLSRLPHPARDPGGIVARGETRDAVQVLANGGIPALCAFLFLLHPIEPFAVGFAGALAAATADTWATEIGSRSSSIPRNMLTHRPVEVGFSGGVTGAGLAGSGVGALVIGIAAVVVLPIPALFWLPVAVAGFSGAVLDSVLGASIQEVRQCTTCGALTEQSIHEGCSTPTLHIRGLPYITNDAVNLLCSATGTAVCLVIGSI